MIDSTRVSTESMRLWVESVWPLLDLTRPCIESARQSIDSIPLSSEIIYLRYDGCKVVEGFINTLARFSSSVSLARILLCPWFCDTRSPSSFPSWF